MFLDEKTQGEAAPVKTGTLKLSEAIRAAGYGDWKDYNDCVLGRAYRRLTGRSLLEDGKVYAESVKWHRDAFSDFVGDVFGVPRKLTDKAERMCFNERHTPNQIADWLESQGF